VRKNIARNVIFLFLIFPLVLQPPLEAKKNPRLPKNYKKWLEEEVVYIITPREKSAFKQLETDKQRNLFIEEFWRQRDPVPSSPQNEFREEHYRRIEYANKWFGRGLPKPGWRTNRGRIYILLGEPITRQTHYDIRIYPVELWFYQGGKGLEPFFYVLFFKRKGAGEYEIYSPLRDGPNALCIETSDLPSETARQQRSRDRFFTGKRQEAEIGGIAYETLYSISQDLAQASLSLIPGASRTHPVGSDRLLGDIEVHPQRKIDDEYAYKFLKTKAVVEVNYSVHYIGNKNTVKTFCDEKGVFFVHYVVQPEALSLEGYEDKYYSQFKTSGRVTDIEGRTIFQFSKSYPMEFTKKDVKAAKARPMNIHDSFPLVPGYYRFNLLLENVVSKEFTSFEKDIFIPEVSESPRMSPLLLAYKTSEVQEPLRQPFQSRQIRIYPSPNNQFSSKETLFIYFQMYALGEKLRGEGGISYNIFRGEEKIYTRTKKIKDYQTQMDFVERFSLEKFEPGRFSVKVSLLDKDRKEILSETEEFTVLSVPFPRAWTYSKKIPSSSDAVYSYLLGAQLLNKGEIEKALEKLEEAYLADKDSPDFVLAYSQALLITKKYEKIKEILIPFLEKPVENYSLYAILGSAFQELEEYEQAISLYQKFISHEGASFQILNALGQCFYELGNIEEALRAWGKSLEIKPDQPDIKEKIEAIKKEEKQTIKKGK
jgi:GWxTD domain-containing protein